MIKIENNIPIPPVKRGGHKNGSAETDFTNAFRTMEVKQSFEVQKERTDISSTISRLFPKGEKKFTMRKVKPFTYRIWRTK